ncbi:hypothetical protein BH09SUM1_BH09SUM1_01980 [soil metagenome]
MRARIQKRRGFTLPEVIVVVAIVAIMSTISVVSYAGYRKDAPVKSAAERVKSLMTEARTRAIADDLPSSVAFDLTNNAIWIDDLDVSGGIRKAKATTPEYLGPDVVIEELKVNSTVYTDDIRHVIFTPNGSNPKTTVTLRRPFDNSTVDTNFYSVQMYPASPEPKVWAHERKS